MAYQIVWSIQAEKELKKLEFGIARRIHEKISELTTDPFRNSIKLVGEKGYRIRIGDYRVIFDIEHNSLRILILKVAHRSAVYRH